MRTFSRLLAPVDSAVFMSRYWHRELLHIRRTRNNAYETLLPPSELGAYLASYSLHPTFIRVIVDGIDRTQRDWTRRVTGRGDAAVTVDPARLMSWFARGATIVVNGAGQALPRLIRLTAALEDELSTHVHANLYITPAGHGGLAPHVDDHDVMVLQLHGQKVWHVCEVNPANGDRQRIELEAGDLLYLPRHTMHEARAAVTSSIHLTLGFQPPQWHHVLGNFLNVESDKPVPPELVADQEALRNVLRDKMASALAMPTEELLAVRHSAATRILDVGSWFENAVNVGSLRPESRIIRRVGTRTATKSREQRLLITVGTETHILVEPLAVIAEALLSPSGGTIREKQGPCPDALGLQIAKDLIRIGALEIESL